MSFNSRSICNKYIELKHVIQSHPAHVICITETHLTELHTNGNLSLDNLYNIVRADRKEKQGGGVAILVKKGIAYEEVNSLIANSERSHLETTWVELTNNDRSSITIGVVYLPPKATPDRVTDLSNLIAQASSLNHNETIVTGDFNHPDVDWATLSSRHLQNHTDHILLKCIKDNFLTQHIHQPTREVPLQSPSILDLVITKQENTIDSIDILPPIGNSDHNCIHFTTNCLLSLKKRKQSLIYHKADFAKISEELQQAHLEENLNNLPLEEAWCLLRETIVRITRLHTPKRKAQSKTRPQWINREVLQLIKRKKMMYHSYRRNKSDTKYEEYKHARNAANVACHKAEQDFETQLARNISSSPKSFYNYVRNKTCQTRPMISLAKSDGTPISPSETAEQFNTFFASVFTKENEPIPELQPLIAPQNRLVSLSISPSEVLKALDNVQTNKAPGPDGIHPQVLKHCRHVIAPLLHIVYNKSLRTGQLPSDWKKGRITPVHKKGSKLDVNNYRPISLTSIPCKILEKEIRKHITNHLEKNNILSQHQYGFRSRRSCITNLLTAIDAWSANLDKNTRTDVIYLDFAKAFDRVPHKRLLTKLKAYGVEPPLYTWIKDFLTERTQTVYINENESSPRLVTSGIPQGSVLGPTLFLIFINDLPSVVINECLLFADDTKVYAPITTDSDTEGLQRDINNLATWSDKWQLHFNSDKCSVVSVGRKTHHTKYTSDDPYIFNGHPLRSSAGEKDLGIQVDEHLTFVNHVHLTAKKANKILGMIKANFTSISMESIKPLYVSLVRPLLEYGTSIWAPHHKYLIEEIEAVQHRATKLVNNLKHLPYEERLMELDLPSLAYRRLREDMVQVYKLLHGLYDTDPSTLFTLCETETRSNGMKLHKPRSITTQRLMFFTQRVINPWNSLPPNVVTSSTLNIFKTNLDKHWNTIRYLETMPSF